MSRTTKIVIGIIGGLAVLCCISVALVVFLLPRFATDFVENNVTDNPEEAAEVGRSIVDYELPEGLHEEAAMNFLGTKMVFIAGGERQGSAVMLMQFPAAVQAGEVEMRRQMEEALSQQRGQQQFDMEIVSEEEVVINDQTTTLTTFEGTDENGNPYRQVTGIFDSKDGGTAMLMALSPISSWEEANIDEFIDSLE
jgi:hypothetical protein